MQPDLSTRSFNNSSVHLVLSETFHLCSSFWICNFSYVNCFYNTTAHEVAHKVMIDYYSYSNSNVLVDWLQNPYVESNRSS